LRVRRRNEQPRRGRGAVKLGGVAGDLEPFRTLMNRRLAETLADYVGLLKESAK
jgi:hypothetical protein